MRVSGIVGAQEYLKRYQILSTFCDVDSDIAGLIADGYCEWDTRTQRLHATTLGRSRTEIKELAAH